jgi:hypothetical protein
MRGQCDLVNPHPPCTFSKSDRRHRRWRPRPSRRRRGARRSRTPVAHADRAIPRRSPGRLPAVDGGFGRAELADVPLVVTRARRGRDVSRMSPRSHRRVLRSARWREFTPAGEKSPRALPETASRSGDPPNSGQYCRRPLANTSNSVPILFAMRAYDRESWLSHFRHTAHVQ